MTRAEPTRLERILAPSGPFTTDGAREAHRRWREGLSPEKSNPRGCWR